MKLIYWLLSLSLFTYVVIRAVNIPFTVDEAWTYLIFLKGSFWDVIACTDPSSNNHILNSLLTKICALFSLSEFSLRLPNVLAFLFYLYSAYKIATLLFRNSVTGLLVFAAMLFSGPLIQFFSLCRGYGLGFSFLTFAVYQLIAVLEHKERKRIHIACTAVIFAAFSNFSLIPGVLSVLAASYFIELKFTEGRNAWLKAIKIPAVYTVLLLALIAYPLHRMTSTSQFYFGGDRNFINSTLQSMLEDMAPNLLYKHYRPFLIAAVMFIGFALVVPLGYFIRSKEKIRAEFAGPFILLCTIVIINLQYYVFGTLFIQYRTAVYLYPLIIIAFFSAIKIISYNKAVASTLLGIGCVSFFGFYFISRMNITETKDWWFDAYNKKILAYAIQHKPAGRKIKIYATYMSANSFNYYIDTKYIDFIEPTPCCIEDIKNIDLHSYDFVFLQNTVDFTAYPEFRIVQSYHDKLFYLYAK